MPNAPILVSTPGKAAIVAAGTGWLHSVVSLGHLAQNAGMTRGQLDSLARHYWMQRLGTIKIKVQFEIIP
ncbi:hypothetical protein AQ740_18140 [Burkholderia pseudomallei]|nr:hypothetical protein AQ740_18140 [Burkholderia pseudomallei]